ncbi:ATP-dependent DNA ligase [Amycolatopsis thermoflava]|uniref:ATP-dependent DNA ligase n=1 Tax=Amycolatopsis thermoflava TaxID=84480 RepID=UPI003828F0A2
MLTRAHKDLTGRFPEVAAAASALGDLVLDGELCALRGDRLEFTGLRLGRPRREAEGVAVVLVLFDVLAAGRRDLRSAAYTTRRSELLRRLPAPRPYVQPIQNTLDEAEAERRWFGLDIARRGIEGYVRKPCRGIYGDPTAPWIKRRWRTTVDLVIAGATGDVAKPRGLVLGYRTPEGRVQLSATSLPLAAPLRAALAGRLRPVGERTALPAARAGLPGRQRELPYVPVEPEVEVEAEVDAAFELGRWRHGVKVLRVRDVS